MEKTCGTCTLCCKIFPVPELGKPAGKWCQHIVQGKGCGIHATRPQVCRDFFCQWIYSPDLGAEWKPEVCRFVMSVYPGTNSLNVSADPGYPNAWREEKYLTRLRIWAKVALEQGDQVLVFNGPRVTAILPDREKDLGEIRPGDRIVSLKSNIGTFDVRLDRAAG